MRADKVRIYLWRLYISVFVVLVVGFGTLYFRTTHAEPIVIHQCDDGTDITDQDVYFTLNRSKGWLETSTLHANQYDGTIFNNCGHEIVDWEFSFKMPFDSSINDSWNIEYYIEDGYAHIKPEECISIVETDESAGFGFIMFSSYDAEFNDFEILATPLLKLSDYKSYYVLLGVSAIWLLAVVSMFSVDINARKYKKERLRDQMIIVQSIKTFIKCIDAKDTYTRGHSARVGYYSKCLARALGMNDEEVNNIYYTALMHDVGKIGIPDGILNKEGKLTDEEREIIKQHTTRGGEILKDFTTLEDITDGALYHHERYDGNGYPAGLKGEAIPFIGRIIAVADAYDAMSTNRCYRAALEHETIISELKNNAGKQFDPGIVEVMLQLIENGSFDNMDEEV